VKPLTVAIYEPYVMGLGGGNLRTHFYFLKYLDRSRFTPIFISPQETEFVDRFRKLGVECLVETPLPSVHRYGGEAFRQGLLGRARSAIDLIRYNVRIAGILRERRVDVVSCHSIRALLFAGLGARLARVPAMFYINGTLENSFLDRIGFFLASRIVFQCEANRDDKYPGLVRFLRRRIDILRYGVDPADISAAETADKSDIIRDLDVRPDRINAVILGQVFRPKGVHLVVAGLREIVRAHPQFMLYIVGDHVIEEYRSHREELDRMIERDGVGGHVCFTGWRTDALKIVSLMDILVHPSLAEGFPRAVMEAMALGRPVVASAVGGLRQLIRDGENGFLVAPGDTPAFVNRITQLAGDASLRSRLGRAARQTVFESYLLEDKIRKLEELWTTLATAPAR
jgi:glycosyltransferase involved in cell wall biosynthesis